MDVTHSSPNEPPAAPTTPPKPQVQGKTLEKTIVKNYLIWTLAVGLSFGLLVVFAPVPFLTFTGDLLLPKDASNPITFGGFLTGVIALAGLYYLIEIDTEQRFAEPSGEALQFLLTVAILIVGFLNLEWEYLAALRTMHPTFLNQDLPIIELAALFAPLLTPNVLFLLISTSLVFNISLAARDSLPLTRRGKSRQIRNLTQKLSQQTATLKFYDDLITNLQQTAQEPAPPAWSTTKSFKILLVALTLVVPIAATGLVYLALLLDPATSDVTIIKNTVVWFATSFTAAWICFETTAHTQKRYWYSNGLLTSQVKTCCVSICTTVIGTFFLFIAALPSCIFYRNEAKVVVFALLAVPLCSIVFRIVRHKSQIRVIGITPPKLRGFFTMSERSARSEEPREQPGRFTKISATWDIAARAILQDTIKQLQNELDQQKSQLEELVESQNSDLTQRPCPCHYASASEHSNAQISSNSSSDPTAQSSGKAHNTNQQ